MNKKMNFWTMLALVFGSQIGSGIFILPSGLAPFGYYGIFGWCVAGLGAVSLAFIFAELCARYPKAGGPHVYVYHAFGHMPAFFVGWTYWLVSWVSSSVLVITAVSCLTPFFADQNVACFSLCFEVVLLSVLTIINCKGVAFSGRVEFVLTLLKFIPFAIVPFCLFQKFNVNNIFMAEQYANTSPIKLMLLVTSLSFWGFIGVECATASVDVVERPSKTIPRALIIGTLAVVLIYFINNLAILGVIPGDVLLNSKAPFVDAINTVFGKNISIAIAIITSIVCIGTLNAWILTSAQISLGLANNGLLPDFFAKKNKNDSPFIGVFVCCFGMLPVIILTQNENFASQMINIIDFSVKAFLFVYLICSFAFIKLNLLERKKIKTIVGVLVSTFCITMIAVSSIESLLIASLFTFSGLLVAPFMKNNIKI